LIVTLILKMKAFQQKGQQLFDAQTAKCGNLDQVKELSFANCSLSPDLIQSKFSQLKNLSRLTMVDMKPPLNDASIGQILKILMVDAGNTSLRALDLCDNKITSFASFPPDSFSPEKFPSLARLILANNKIDSFDKLGLTTERFPALRTLDVADNGEGDLLVDSADVRKEAFARCPSLVVVNGKNKAGEDFYDASDNDEDFDDDDDEGFGDADAFLDEEEEDEDVEDEGQQGEGEGKLSPARRQREE